MPGISVQLTSSSNIKANNDINPSNNEKAALGENILKVKNGVDNISLPRLYPQNTHSDEISIKIEGLKSSITSIKSFHSTGLSFSKEPIANLLKPNLAEATTSLSEPNLAEETTSPSEPNLAEATTSDQRKLNTIGMRRKFEIPKISDEQQTILFNNKINSKIINDQTKNEPEDNNKSNIEYEKIQNRYELNSNKFSAVKKFIENKTATDQEKKNKLKKYLTNNDLSMKKIGKFERFKNIFGLSNKINWIVREQRTDALHIFNKLKENSENINKK